MPEPAVTPTISEPSDPGVSQEPAAAAQPQVRWSRTILPWLLVSVPLAIWSGGG